MTAAAGQSLTIAEKGRFTFFAGYGAPGASGYILKPPAASYQKSTTPLKQLWMQSAAAAGVVQQMTPQYADGKETQSNTISGAAARI